MRKEYRVLFWIVIVGLFIAGCIGANYMNETTQVHKVLSIDKIQETEGDSDGFYTKVYYLVSTDQGAYHIRTKGLNAAPQCASIKKDSTYTLTTRGISIPILGVYQCIVDVRRYDQRQSY